MDALVAIFLGWIFTKTGLSAAAPHVVFVPQDVLGKMAFGSGNHETLQLQSLYNAANTTVYLSDTWSEANLREESFLLHELVHHVQRSNRMPARCAAEFEKLAFDLQVAWLREHGVEDPYKLIDTDEFTIFLLSRCAGDLDLNLQ
jgi:hypothetical protein